MPQFVKTILQKLDALIQIGVFLILLLLGVIVLAFPKLVFLGAILLLALWPTHTKDDHPKSPSPDPCGSSENNARCDYCTTVAAEETHSSKKAVGAVNDWPDQTNP